MSYKKYLITKFIKKNILFLALLSWALFASYAALLKKKELILIGIDESDTRIISENHDPLLKTESVNFIKHFIKNLYNFDSINFLENVGEATSFMSQNLWEENRAKLKNKKLLIEKKNITHSAVIEEINKSDKGLYEVLMGTVEKEKLKKRKRKLKVSLELGQVERTAVNPWGMEVKKIEEAYIN